MQEQDHTTQRKSKSKSQKTKSKKPIGGTIKEWYDWYEQRTGGEIKPHKAETFIFDPMKGFFSFIPDFESRILFGHYTAGDGRFWFEQAMNICRHFNFKKLRFFTKHNPRIVERFCGARAVAYDAELRGYFLEAGVSRGT